jgi:hypothetical protein
VHRIYEHGIHLTMAAATLVLLLLPACSPDTDPYTGEADAPEWVIASEPSVSIGEVDGPPEYVLSRVMSVLLLPEGLVAVADGGSNTVRIYGPDGDFVRQLGREGDGPGEFRYLNEIQLVDPDTLLAYDSEHGRLTTFLTGGEVLAETPSFRAPDGRVEVYLGRFDDGDHAGAWIVQEPRDPESITPDVMRMAKFGPDGETRAPLGIDHGMRRVRTRWSGGPTPWSPHFLGAVLGDAVYHTDGVGGVVRITDGAGEHLGVVRPDLSPWDPDDARADLEPNLDSASAERLAELRGTPGLDTIPVVSDLLVDARGRLWLKRYDPSVDSHWLARPRTGGDWTVLDRDGVVSAHVAVPPGFRLLDVRDERVAGVTRDELGVERVEVRALVR